MDFVLIRTGVGYHIYDSRWDTPQAMTFELELKLYFCFEILYTLNSGLAKTSALLLYLRVFPTGWTRRASYISIACIATITLTFLLISFLACRPFSANWAFQLRKNGYCMDRNPSFIVSCILTIMTDLLVLALPLRPIWGLQMDKKIKLGLICVFVSGIVVTVFSFIRLYFVAKADYAYDFTYTGAKAMFFTALEPALMVMCISLPMLYTLFPKRSSQQRGVGYQLKPRTLYALGRSLGRNNKRRFTPIEDTRLINYDVTDLPQTDPDQRSVEASNETITVWEAFSVRAEPARPGKTFGGPAPPLSVPYSATAWSEGKYQG
ncbi:hypothetical protein F4779DRAFT_192723 [Xylariaceae sp. FL0662B]|nr:hypothetical protein F4779DRAFT_192723 [Xylariaceae sp. FL0662B]